MISAKQQALHDIMEDLHQEHRCFLAFKKELNPVMKELVKEYLKEQKQYSHETKR